MNMLHLITIMFVVQRSITSSMLSNNSNGSASVLQNNVGEYCSWTNYCMEFVVQTPAVSRDVHYINDIHRLKTKGYTTGGET